MALSVASGWMTFSDIKWEQEETLPQQNGLFL